MTIDLGRELRLAHGLELRQSTDGSNTATFRGYGSVTDTPYDVYGGPDLGGWTETIAEGAFKRTLGIGENRALLYAHDHSRVLATTRAGTLTLAEDTVGLLVEAVLNTRVAWVADLVAQIEDGTVDEMSIGFYAKRAEWSPDWTARTITELALVETTVVWAGANGATVATIDRAKAALADARARTGRRVAVAAQAAAARLAI